jgi:hypothetical protein
VNAHDELEAKVARLEATIARMQGDDVGEAPPVSRRRALRMAAAVAGGAIAAPFLLSAQTAGADNGNAILIGQLNQTTAGNNGASTILSQGPDSNGNNTSFLVKHPNSNTAPFFAGTAPLRGCRSPDGEGILGWCAGATGWGVLGESDAGVGVRGVTQSGVDLRAAGTGRISFNSNFTFNGLAPTYTAFGRELVFDSSGALWAGQATTWRRVNSLVPIAPMRVMDSRNPNGSPNTNGSNAVSGSAPGPFANGQSFTLSLSSYNNGTLIPTNVAGLALVITLITGASQGFLKAYPGGSSEPAGVVANNQTNEITNHYPVVAVGTGANQGQVTFKFGGGATGIHIVIDVAGLLV